MSTEHKTGTELMKSTGNTSSTALTTSTGKKSSAEKKSAEHAGKAELRAEASLARAELASTLDAIEYKLNVPKQIAVARRRLIIRLRKLGRDNPAGLVGVALGAAAVAGTAVWLGVQAVVKR